MWNRRNKFHAVRSAYNGVMYDSKREAAYAAQLDLRQRAKDIDSWEPKPPRFDLRVNGARICTYQTDFKVSRDGRSWYVEVKGHETREWKLKHRLFAALFPDVVLEVVT